MARNTATESSSIATSRFFSFPDPVNEVAARSVAWTVVVLCAVTLAWRQPWPLIPLAYGFWARVLAGPRVSPAGLFATRVVAPRLVGRAKFVPGPPKRFAQAIGTAFSSTALALWFAFGLHTAALGVVGALVVAAFLEAAFAVCLGCAVFSFLMKIGVIPESVCVACADITRRTSAPAPAGRAA